MKLAALLFFGLLAYAHQATDLYMPLDQPLSCFRDSELGLLGYALFCSIVLVGALYAIGLRQAGQPAEAANAVVAGVILVIVAATPSTGMLHIFCAMVLLATMYAYYGVLLYRSGSPLLLAHLAVPILLAAATQFQSYGIWQKSLICYFIIAGVVHLHMVRRRARMPAAAEADVFYKKPKVYRPDPGQTWALRDVNRRQ
jgi:hypothetical protein